MSFLFSFASVSFAVKGQKELEKQEDFKRKEKEFEDNILEMFSELSSEETDSDSSDLMSTLSDEYKYPDTTFENEPSGFEETSETSEISEMTRYAHHTYQDYRHSDWSSVSTYSLGDIDAMVHAQDWIDSHFEAGPSEPRRTRSPILSRLRGIRNTAFLALRSLSPLLFR